MSEPSTLPPDTIQFNDRIVRNFLIMTLVWGIVGLLVGVILALQLAGMGSSWDLGLGFLNQEWLGFGRLRPLHTNAVIFAFTGNAIFGGVYYSIQRLLKARLAFGKLVDFQFWSWNLIIVAAAITLPLGITTGKEYAELEWPIDIAIAVSWISFGAILFGTIYKRRERHLYVAIWFFIATWVGITMLHVVNSMEVPASMWKSYSLYSGVRDALVQWWYGHNAVAFFLTTPILGLMYYYLPKAAGRPVYSYRLSILHFWALVFIYIWAGPHHLLHTALPEWAQTLGVTFSIVLWMPSWAGMLNGLLTLRGAWDKVRSSPVLKFLVVSVTFYGMSTFEGPMMSLRNINALSHNTDWTIGHVHSGALGWVGFMCFGMTYWLIPTMYKTKLWSEKMANSHFWMATIGIVLYAITMWITGIMQGSMWFEFTDEGTLRYQDWMAMYTEGHIPFFYMVRMFGGLLYLTGAILALINIVQTMRNSNGLVEDSIQATPLIKDTCYATAYNEEMKDAETPREKFWAVHALVERWPFLLILLTTLALLFGGIIEIVPTMIQSTQVAVPNGIKPWTPLEMAGRDVYIREGCVNCHTQMVRTLRPETERYGPHTRPEEGVYDHPFLWGSKRTGPDLAREALIKSSTHGGNLWHWRHMYDPQLTSEGSVMPNYAHLYDTYMDEGDMDSLARKLTIWRDVLATPYDDCDVETVTREYDEQATLLVAELEGAMGDIVDVSVPENAKRTEIVALLAYLNKLGSHLKENGDTK